MKHYALRKNSSRLFVGVYPGGIVYADKAVMQDGDYKKVAFLPYTTLELEWRAPKSPLRAEVIEHAATIQAKRGQLFGLSQSAYDKSGNVIPGGQSVILGPRSNTGRIAMRRNSLLPVATFRTSADDRAEIRQLIEEWRDVTSRVSLIKFALRTVTRELAEIDFAVDEEEDGAEVLWAHRPVAVREKRRLDGILTDLQRRERRVLKGLESYGIDPERDYRS